MKELEKQELVEKINRYVSMTENEVEELTIPVDVIGTAKFSRWITGKVLDAISLAGLQVVPLEHKPTDDELDAKYEEGYEDGYEDGEKDAKEAE